MGNIRGQSLLALTKYLKDNFGQGGLTKALDTLELLDREVFKAKLQPMGWYPAKAFISLLAACEDIFGKGDYELCYKIGAFSAEQSFSGIYKIFIEFSDVNLILNKASVAWRIINDVGSLEVSDITANSAKGRIKGYDYPHKAFCSELTGYFTKVLELVGAREVVIKQTKCCADGEPYCEYELKWE